ncbi:lipase-like PAD4 [Gastrolobium bilobum]|uniref:lipase-like PAD4 n=1 Tax=Gastrolobium bilobum TaxID=150636 RepID=UPI002AB07E76|nr:lipase-like PAD4 [Gastrolobium bilobum]
MVPDEASQFETSEMLATFLASTPLLSESWRLCSMAATAPPGSFVTERSGGGVVYVAFPGVQMVVGSDSSWRNLVPLDSIGDVPLFSSHRNKEGIGPVMVHAGMLNLFWSFFKPFQNQMLAIMENSNTKSIVITGHSIGGATASLCALWLLSYLQHIPSSVSLSVLCITFGSPLLGNGSFSRAILKERWGGNFCHVVSKHDIMPRLLFAPIVPHTAQLNNLLQVWQLSMTAPHFGKLAVQISDKQKAELFNFVMSYLHAATQMGEGSVPIMFHPFGSYFFVSEEGAVCVDSSTTVVKMMHLMLLSSSPACSIEDHLKYGDYVNKLSLQFLNQKNSMQGNIPESSYEAGLELAVQSSGLANQESAIEPAKECLKMTRRMGPSPTQNAARLAVRLSKVVPYRAEIEWYKAWCDQQIDQMGYYDLFKRRRGFSKRDMKVNMNRRKLARFWDNVIDMKERNELPHDFEMRAKWVNASHFYKLLVEPLDIAEYYGKRMHTTKGHYIKHGRERRYEVFDRWWKDTMVTAEENNERSKFASLTQDSCFWARVEEAMDWLNGARSESDTSKLAVLWDHIEKFEKYAMKLIENKEVSQDVLAKNSSYSIWVEDLKELRELKAKVKRFPHNFAREVVPK